MKTSYPPALKSGLVLLMASLIFTLCLVPAALAQDLLPNSSHPISGQQGKVQLYIDGKLVQAQPIMVQGRAYLPLRFLAESLGLSISWQAQTRAIFLETKAGPRPPVTPPPPNPPPIIEKELGPTAITSDHKIPVLMYHHLAEEWQKSPGIIISSPTFREHMEALLEAGYQAVHFKDLEAQEKRGLPLPEKPVIITFDDGYQSNYSLAYPVLKDLGFKANMNPIISTVGKTPGSLPHFSWQAAREMVASGLIEIGSHSYDLHGKGVVPHKGESQKDFLARLATDTQLAKKVLGQEKIDASTVYCYPYGKYSPLSQKAVQEEGYLYQLTVRPGILDKTSLRKEIPRLTIRGDMSGQDLLRLIDRWEKK